MFNFKQILQNLKHSNQFNRSSIIREIVANLRHINKNELIDLLELLHINADIEFRVKLLSILTACLLFNNTNRDVIIKWTPLYETLCKILDKGLPMKSAVTLDFVTSLLFADDESSRARSLSLHAQCMIRTSGCLTAITYLFTNYMLPIDTWTALCRCVAEVCRGCEPNQTFCSHLIPLCIQRCLPGNLDAFPVLLSLLSNHKRNTHLFLKTDGKSLFDRKELFRVENCLQLLNTVIQNAEFDALTTLTKQTRIYEYLHELLKLQSPHSNVTQWATIVVYYLDSTLKGKCNNENSNARNNDNGDDDDIVRNTSRVEVNEVPNVNDTLMLFQNIMGEILSHPPKRDSRKSWKHFCEPLQTFSNAHEMSQRVRKEKNVYDSDRIRLCNKEPSKNSSDLSKRQLSFSFLMDKSIKYDEFNQANINYPTTKTNQAKVNTTKHTCFTKELGHSKRGDTFKTFNRNFENIIEFKPTFVSTPIRELSQVESFSLHRNTSGKRCLKESNNKSRIRNRTPFKKIPKKTISQDKSSIKQRSMSSRLLEAINESCTTIIKSVKNVFIGNKTSTSSKQAGNKQKESARTEARKAQTYCSYSFTNYMRKREPELMKLKDDTNKSVNSEENTHNILSTCKTCDDTLLLKQKFDIDENLKLTVKKLKLGINLYGCDFKRISKTMWPRERCMTPTVLYNLYRKLILK